MMRTSLARGYKMGRGTERRGLEKNGKERKIRNGKTLGIIRVLGKLGEGRN